MSGPRVRGWKDILLNAERGARVLIVDDEPRVRRSLERLVGDFGCETRGSASAEEGDHWLNAESFDLVLLDIELPMMNGMELLKWILHRDPEQSVVMLTGMDDHSLAMQCLDAGARNYLVKPADPDILERVVRDAVAVGNLLKAYNRLRAEASEASVPAGR